MKREEFEVALPIILGAVNEQYILPIVLALGTLTVALCHDPEIGRAVSRILQEQYESCPDDVPGRIYLSGLASLADPDEQDARKKDPSTFLRLVPGGDKKKKF